MRLLSILMTATLTALPICAGDLVRPDDEIRLPLAEGWLAGDDTGGFPVQLVNSDLTAEMRIFRSELAEDEAITDPQLLRRSVNGIIEDVILSLPEAELLTNTGFNDDNRVRFVLEFLSFDSATASPLRHRLMGVLYSHPEGHQLLFTLWGKSSDPLPADVAADWELMQNGFRYFGPAMDKVFIEPADHRYWWFGAVIIALLLILRLRRKRIAA